jgi:cytochrome c peroxidase
MAQEKNVLEQNVEMWEKMTTTYMDSMFKAMEKTMEQSAVFQKQLDQAVNTAVSAQFEATLSAIKAVERQVETLSSKVDQFLKEEK